MADYRSDSAAIFELRRSDLLVSNSCSVYLADCPFAHLRPSFLHQRNSLAPRSAVATMSGRPSLFRSAMMTELALDQLAFKTCGVHLPFGSPGFSNHTIAPPTSAVATTSMSPSPSRSAAATSNACGKLSAIMCFFHSVPLPGLPTFSYQTI